jgi:E3 ubiquitin-protein ligase SHPRH
VYSWRSKIIELLASPIESEALPEQGTNVEDPEAEYYAQALQAQGEIEAYLIAYAAAVGDRRGALDAP